MKKVPFAATWIELEGIMLSEINQKEKDKYLLLTCRNYKIQQTSEYNEKKNQTHRYRELVVTSGERGGTIWGWLHKWYKLLYISNLQGYTYSTANIL